MLNPLIRDLMLGAGVDAFTAQDALRVSMHMRNINPHGAHIGADIAVRASLFMNFYMKETYFIERPEDCADRAEVSTPAALHQEDEHEKKDEDHQCDREEVIRDVLPRVKDQDRDCSSENPDRANVSEDKTDEHRGSNDQTEKYHVFHVPHRFLHGMLP
jgi:hypothetical protein